MDEIEYKLNTKNSVLVVNAIEKLISTVKSKFKPAERQRFVLENEELKFLREKCSSKNTVVSLTACQGLLALVEGGVLEIGHTMSTIVTLLPTAHNYSAIISTMAGLLILDLKSRLCPDQTYKCQFSLRSPQHPFITVLEKNKEATEDVLTQMHALCHHPDYIVSSNSLELLQTVFLWLTCTPKRSSNLQPWQLLLSLQQSRSQEHLLLDCVSWQQTGNPKLIASAFTAYSAVTETAIYQKERELVMALLPMLARLSNELIKHGELTVSKKNVAPPCLAACLAYCSLGVVRDLPVRDYLLHEQPSHDPRACYSLMERSFALDLAELRTVAGLTVALLADNLTITCALHLHQLFNLCLNIISKYEYPSISLDMFVALSLQWLHLPSILTNNALKVASKILETYQNKTNDDNRLNMPNLQANKQFNTLLHTDRNLSITFRLFKTWERIKDEPTKLRSWFDGLEQVDQVVQLDLVSFLIGILMDRRKDEYFEDIALRALRIVVKLVDVRKELAAQLLPILLYKIANDASPIMRLECLRAVPLMAKTKENVPTIVSQLNKLKGHKSIPTSTLITLFTSLTEVQSRCFPYLQEVLVEVTQRPHDLKWEVEVSRSIAVRRVCELRSSQGIELVPVISSILNRCTDASSALAAAHALDALRYLWRHYAVAPISTWTALQSKLARDKRPKVQISICNLLAEVPQLRINTPEYDTLLRQTSARLWQYLAESSDPDVIEAACKALSHYTITMYTLKDVPEVYRKTVKLPASYCKTPADAARRPEDVLDYIPCEVWPEVFKYSCQDALPAIRHLTSKLIEVEIQGFRSGVYQPETRGEPQSMSYLPSHSVLRGLTDFIRKQATSPSYDCPPTILLEILRALSSEYPKPIPPLELSFLHSLFHVGQHWRQPCLLLAARQANTSGSAKLLVDNYLLTVDTLEEQDIIMVFQLLPQLCRTMPPNSLRLPLEKCLAESFSKISYTKSKDVKEEERKEILFIKELELIRECLENDKIHDANRTLLSQFVENYLTIIGDDSVAWDTYVRTCTALSTKYLERMTSPLSWWEVTRPLLRKSVAIRCALASSEDCSEPLTWLNEIVDVAAQCMPEQEYTLHCMMPALKSAPPTEVTRDWLLQLMARTQVAFAESEDAGTKSYFWNVFVYSVLLLSGHWSFEPDSDELPSQTDVRLALFPAAVTSLFSRDTWKNYAPQVLECLCHTRSIHPDSTAALSCKRALLCMKHNDHFATNFWTKAVHDRRLYE